MSRRICLSIDPSVHDGKIEWFDARASFDFIPNGYFAPRSVPAWLEVQVYKTISSQCFLRVWGGYETWVNFTCLDSSSSRPGDTVMFQKWKELTFIC